MGKITKNLILNGLIIILIMSFAIPSPAKTHAAVTQVAIKSEQNPDGAIVTLDRSISYVDYLTKHKDAVFATNEIIIEAAEYSSSSYTPEIKENYENKTGKSILTSEDGYVEWSVTIPKVAFYNIGVDYFPVAGKSSTINRQILIDGALPFEEARSLDFTRVWSDEKVSGKAIAEDSKGNDLRPSQIETPKWMSSTIYDSIGYISSPLKFFFTKGNHTIRLLSVKEPMLISQIRLFKEKELPSYSEIKQEYSAKVYMDANAGPTKLEAEISLEKSDPVIVPVFDRSTPAVSPSDPVKLKLNCLGGERWNISGQWVSWEFQVPQTGLYKIGIKAKQDIMNGAFSNRRIYIDDAVPFKELDNITFNYNTRWQMITLGDKAETYKFYLETGKKHTLKMEVSLGEMAEVIKKVSTITEELNQIYRKILIITGPAPDVNRDYQFEKIMPDVIANMKIQTKLLSDARDEVIDRTGLNGETIQILNKLVIQLNEMVNDPETIANRFTNFQSNISALGTWVMDAKKQPLTIDYLIIAPEKYKMPSPTAQFWDNLKYQFSSFAASFYNDYNSISDVDSTQAVKVWVGSGLTGGRDQAQVLKTMADNYFTPDSKIKVNLQLISMGALLPATLSGKGPDVALTVGQGDPVNYAVRNAVIDIAQFPDFPEIAKRFSPSAFVPLSFDKGVYALPESQTFPIMFYRKDILSELKIRLPQTWDDVIEILPVLQKKQLNFGMPTAVGANIGASMTSFSMLLFQNGGQFYSDDGKYSSINSDKSIESFMFLTSLYKDYQIPKVIDFVNRFRIGSTPIGIADYSLYNQLSVFAPELDGIWDFTSVPGTRKADGTIDRSVAGSVNACIIMKKSTMQKESWEFIKWWTSAEIQVRFGRELESIMGTAARYPTANLEALYQMPWKKENLDKLVKQWDWVKAVPEVPGGYYTPRYVDFAFRDVIENNLDAGELLSRYKKTIDNEIKTKRREFGLKN